MKRILLFTLVLPFLLASCTQNNVSQEEFAKTMILSSQGKVSVVPDMANFTISLKCLDKNIEKSRNCLIKKSKAINEMLLENDVKTKDIQTTRINQEKRYHWTKTSRVFDGYESNLNMNVAVRNMDALNIIYTILLTDEKVDVSYLSYNHSKRDSLTHVAYKKALQNADALAENILEETTLRKKEILRIANVKLDANPLLKYKRSRGDKNVNLEKYYDREHSFDINEGLIDVYQTLNVEYLMK